MLYETFWNFISNDYRDYIGDIWKQSKNVYKSYDTFIANIVFLEIVINYINKPQYLSRPYIRY